MEKEINIKETFISTFIKGLGTTLGTGIGGIVVIYIQRQLL